MGLFTGDELRAALAEFMALTLFVWIGCGTAVSAQAGQLNAADGAGPVMNDFLVSVALAFGLGISVLAYGIGHISGGHINPAVTFGFFILGKIKLSVMLLYWIAQTLGAITGAAILWACVYGGYYDSPAPNGEYPPYLLGSNFLTPNITVGSGFFIEFMGTFLLVWTVMMSAAHPGSGAGNCAPIAIGWSVALAHFVCIPFTGCGINPARSFGPHLVVLATGYKVGTRGCWIFYTAPFVGSACATLIARFVYGADKDDEEEEEVERSMAEPAPVAEDSFAKDEGGAEDKSVEQES